MDKNKILANWNFTRLTFFAIGLWMVFQAGLNREWVGVFLGGYLAAKGIFAFGCASGNCSNRNCDTKPDEYHTK